MSVSDKLKGLKVPEKRRDPLWKGPEVDGVTFSLLSRFLTCRERFRIRVVEGLRPADAFHHRIEYGQMWHVCEEALAKFDDNCEHDFVLDRGSTVCKKCRLTETQTEHDVTVWWQGALKSYVGTLCRRYPLSQEQIVHWYEVCKVQFPLYVDHWAKHRDVVERTPLLQEAVFNVPYDLPSGRTVRLRGKFDAVDLIGRGKEAGIWLFETKTKGDVDEQQMKRQLTWDLQTMLYITALTWDTGIDALEEVKKWDGKKLTVPIKGVRYNVIRRPLSGGKGTIVRHKPTKSNPAGESREAYYQRVAQYIREEPEHYFMRWNATVTPSDVARFRRECLDPILEQLCDWWEWICYQPKADGPYALRDLDLYAPRETGNGEPWLSPHWRHPFGCANTIDEYGSSDLDAYLESGSEVGLRRVDDLFPELK